MVKCFVSLLLFVLLVSEGTALECKANSQVQDLWVGTVDFLLPNVIDNTMAFTFNSYTLPTPRPYNSNSNLQYCFGLKDMSTQTGNLFYIDLLVLKTYQSNIVINFIFQPNKWTKVKFNYWISFRKDLTMGIQSFNKRNFQSIIGNGGIIKSRVDVIDQQINSQNCIIMIFVAGVRYTTESYDHLDEHRFSFNVVRQVFKDSVITIEFNTTSHLPIESVTISYLIYAPSYVNFGSYGGIITQTNFKGNMYKSLRYLFPSHHFQPIYGISALQATKNKESAFQFNSSLNQFYQFQYGVKEWQLLAKIQITYVIAGLMPAQICQEVTQCKNQGKIFILGHQCVAQCPASSKMVRHVDRSIQCKQCPPNQHFEDDSQNCICDNGFEMNQNTGKCVQVSVQNNPAITYARQNQGDTLGGDQLSQPSVLSRNCLKMTDIQQSNKNIFVTLQAQPQVYRASNSNEPGFINIIFPDTNLPVSYYCNKCTRDESLFECLLLFASGLPDKLFTIQISCKPQIQGSSPKQCKIQIPYKSIHP